MGIEHNSSWNNGENDGTWDERGWVPQHPLVKSCRGQSPRICTFRVQGHKEASRLFVNEPQLPRLMVGQQNTMCIYIYVCVCICVYVYVYIYNMLWVSESRLHPDPKREFSSKPEGFRHSDQQSAIQSNKNWRWWLDAPKVNIWQKFWWITSTIGSWLQKSTEFWIFNWLNPLRFQPSESLRAPLLPQGPHTQQQLTQRQSQPDDPTCLAHRNHGDGVKIGTNNGRWWY